MPKIASKILSLVYTVFIQNWSRGQKFNSGVTRELGQTWKDLLDFFKLVIDWRDFERVDRRQQTSRACHILAVQPYPYCEWKTRIQMIVWEELNVIVDFNILKSVQPLFVDASTKHCSNWEFRLGDSGGRMC